MKYDGNAKNSNLQRVNDTLWYKVGDTYDKLTGVGSSVTASAGADVGTVKLHDDNA